MDSNLDLYKTLGLTKSATQIDIKKAYRKKALLHHPDKGGNEEQFKKISHAYEILKDPDKRNIYDNHGLDGLKNNPDIQDFFTNIFSTFKPFTNIFHQFNKHVNKPQPIIHIYNVTLEQLCLRKLIKLKYSRNILCNCSNNTKCITCKGSGHISLIRQIGIGIMQHINKTCNDCNGSGTINTGCDKCKNGFILQTNIVQLHLTPHMYNGYKYIFPEQGNQSNNSDQTGDFIVILKYKEHPIFKHNNNDLITTQQISLKEALTGFVKTIKHPNGDNININTTNSILTPESNFIVPQKGLNNNGNLILNIQIIFPQNLQKNQIKQLKLIL
jgi:DnaJ family protein A protein 2